MAWFGGKPLRYAMEWLATFTKIVPFWLEHPLRGIAAIAAVALALWSVWPVLSKAGEGSGTPPPGSVTVNNSTFNAPSQIGGQGNTMNVNQPAYFEKKASVESRQDATGYHLRVHVPVHPGGLWQPGTEMKFNFRLSHLCRSWHVEPETFFTSGGVLPYTFGPETNTDTIFFATSAAPRPGKDVVFDINCDLPTWLTQASWQPVSP